MKAVEPTGRFREKLKQRDIPPDAEELADNASTRETTLFDRFWTNLAANPRASASVAAMNAGIAAQAATATVDRTDLPATANDTSSYESAMVALQDVRDGLVDKFPSVSGDKALYKLFTDSIHRIEAGMAKLGMEIDPFNPLTSLSGLSTGEEILANANEVVANTTRRYTLHKIADIRAEVYRGVPSIALRIEGEDAGTSFVATGRVVAPNDFSGNEAVDFVTKGGQCALGVKAVSMGRMVDVSDRFSIDFDVQPVEKKGPEVAPEPTVPPKTQ